MSTDTTGGNAFPTLVQAIVVGAANDAGLVDVVVPSFEDQQKFNDLPCETHAGHGPSIGTRCLVGRDEWGALWVIAWYEGNSDEVPRHVRSQPTGHSDHGSSAADARGVHAPSSAGSWTNRGSSGSYPAGSHVPVAPWIVPILDYAVDHGWNGVINEGWRSLETQQYYWDHAAELGLIRGVSVAHPGQSNHGGLDYPRGAIDTSDQAGMAAAMASYPHRRKLVWYGPKDSVHWSASGH